MNLRSLRKERGLTRKFISEKLNITGSYLNKLENRKYRLTYDKATKLAEIYCVRIEDILED